SDYRGELMVTLYTAAPGLTHVVRHGDRIAQLVITRLAPVRFEASDALNDTERGAGGHGSTGRRPTPGSSRGLRWVHTCAISSSRASSRSRAKASLPARSS